MYQDVTRRPEYTLEIIHRERARACVGGRMSSNTNSEGVLTRY